MNAWRINQLVSMAAVGICRMGGLVLGAAAQLKTSSLVLSLWPRNCLEWLPARYRVRYHSDFVSISMRCSLTSTAPPMDAFDFISLHFIFVDAEANSRLRRCFVATHVGCATSIRKQQNQRPGIVDDDGWCYTLIYLLMLLLLLFCFSLKCTPFCYMENSLDFCNSVHRCC